MAVCVMCLEEFDPSDVTFEQRLINDDSFCLKCWTDIMDREYDGEFDINLAEMIQKGKES